MKLALLLLLLAAPLHAQRLDPDNCWTCRDSWEHFGSGAGLDIASRLTVPHHAWQRIGTVMLIGVVWESAQADVARTTNLYGRGFGFGLKDLACDALGALVGELLWQFL